MRAKSKITVCSIDPVQYYSIRFDKSLYRKHQNFVASTDTNKVYNYDLRRLQFSENATAQAWQISSKNCKM